MQRLICIILVDLFQHFLLKNVLIFTTSLTFKFLDDFPTFTIGESNLAVLSINNRLFKAAQNRLQLSLDRVFSNKSP